MLLLDFSLTNYELQIDILNVSAVSLVYIEDTVSYLPS